MITKNWICITNNTADTLLLQGNKSIILSVIIYNSDSTNSGNIIIKITDKDDNLKSTLFNIYVEAEDTIILDSKIFINDTDKLKVKTSIAGFNITASGTEG